MFFSLTKGLELIPNYHALQIAGRAGRFGTQYAHGQVTTLLEKDLGLLRDLLAQPVVSIQQVGIAPTFEQIEHFAFHLPKATFVNLLDIFISLCSVSGTGEESGRSLQVSDEFFLCDVDQIRDLAVLIDKISLPLDVRFNFCKVPLRNKGPLGTWFVKMARRYSSGFALTEDWFGAMIQWPPPPAQTLADVVHLEHVYDILTAYVWLGLRYEHMLPDVEVVRAWSDEVTGLIGDGIQRLVSFQPQKNSHVTEEDFQEDD